MGRPTLVYQVYPRSFCSSKDNGICDFQGIISKLDYIADLGFTDIWINPFYPSGGKDGGYDITDHTSVDPRYGTMEDFEELVAVAAERNIGIIIDLVAGHVSDQHPWFIEASSSTTNNQRDRFVWRDPAQRNNWLSIFSRPEPGPAWTTHPTTRKDYLHHFYS